MRLPKTNRRPESSGGGEGSFTEEKSYSMRVT